jgi:dihydrofolate reductase
MGKIVAVEYLTLDGVMEEPRWSEPYFNDEVARFQYDNLFGSDALLLGRVTYEGFKAAWPTMTDGQGFADRMNGLPKFVTTATLTEPEWNATLLDGDVSERVAALKTDFAGTLLLNGSGRLFQALHAAGLIDEYRLMFFPVVLGAGRRLFPEGSADGALKLVKSQITSSGVALLSYRPDNAAA